MRVWNTWTRKASAKAGKVVMALVIASAIGGVFVAPAFGKDNNWNNNDRHYDGRRDNDRYNYDRRQNYRDRRRVYQPPARYYQAPVYVPPPVVYSPAPYQSPGISLFFPFFTR